MSELSINLGSSRVITHNGRIGDLSRRITYHAILSFAILASLLENTPLAILKKCKTHRHGYEAWRLLVLEFEPWTDSRAMALVTSCNEAKMINASGDLNSYAAGLMQWEAQISEYENLTGDDYPDRHRKAVMFSKASPEIRTHMQVNAATIANAADARAVIMGYLQSKINWADAETGGIVPMEIEAIDSSCKWCAKGKSFKHQDTKGKSKGKGKDGKGKGKNGK
jgi:hypothetical protein